MRVRRGRGGVDARHGDVDCRGPLLGAAWRGPWIPGGVRARWGHGSARGPEVCSEGKWIRYGLDVVGELSPRTAQNDPLLARMSDRRGACVKARGSASQAAGLVREFTT